MKLSSLFVFFLAVNLVTSLNQYVYEFGQNVGEVIYNYDGNIPLLQTVTNKDIIVPQGVTVTYVRVTVRAISPPKVDYHADVNRVLIAYSWTQVTMSQYSIVAKATVNFAQIQYMPKILTYEYGKRRFGDVMAYAYVGILPAYHPNYNFTVNPLSAHLGLDIQFTYLRVHYANPLSKVNISFNPNTSIIEFHIKYPFINFPFGVDAYSLLFLRSENKTDSYI